MRNVKAQRLQPDHLEERGGDRRRLAPGISTQGSGALEADGVAELAARVLLIALYRIYLQIQYIHSRYTNY